MNLKGNFPHFHLVFDVTKHLGVELGFCFTELGNLIGHDLFDLDAGLSQLSVSELVLEVSYSCLLLRKCMLCFDLLSLRLVLLVRGDSTDKVPSPNLLEKFLDEAVIDLASYLVLLLELCRLIEFFLTGLPLSIDPFNPFRYVTFILLCFRILLLLSRGSRLGRR